MVDQRDSFCCQCKNRSNPKSGKVRRYSPEHHKLISICLSQWDVSSVILIAKGILEPLPFQIRGVEENIECQLTADMALLRSFQQLHFFSILAVILHHLINWKCPYAKASGEAYFLITDVGVYTKNVHSRKNRRCACFSEWNDESFHKSRLRESIDLD